MIGAPILVTVEFLKKKPHAHKATTTKKTGIHIAINALAERSCKVKVVHYVTHLDGLTTVVGVSHYILPLEKNTTFNLNNYLAKNEMHVLGNTIYPIYDQIQSLKPYPPTIK